MFKNLRYLFPIVLFALTISTYISQTSQNELYAQEIPSDNTHKVTIHFFWGRGCPHCAEEEKFLEKLEQELPNIEIKRYEVWYNSKNQKFMQSVAKLLNANVSGVPFTVVGSNYFVGYGSDETSGEQLRQMILECQETACADMLASLTNPNDSPTPKPPKTPKTNGLENAPASVQKNINVSLIGTIDLTTLSLPAIAVVIGALDGFNPCALWTLLFLLSILLSTPSRKRVLVLGGGFILISGLSYFLMMTAWLNILLFLGFLTAIRVTIGLFGLGSGLFNLKKYYDHKTGCIAENSENRKKTFNKIKAATNHKNLFVAFLGIAALAFAVNLLELLCSAGFPAIFTQILALNNLSSINYYALILLYLVFFLMDDIIVFLVALVTLKSFGISTKYTKWSHLIGGALMLIIGLLLIFKPEYLMFSF